MRTLSQSEFSYVSGGAGHELIVGGAALAGGLVLSSITSYLPFITTPVSVIVGGVGAGAACTLVAPVVGTVLCGAAGAVGGYFVGSSLATFGAFFVGAGLGGAAAFTGLS